MRHSPLLGSTFRSTALKPTPSDIGPALLDSGMLGQYGYIKKPQCQERTIQKRIISTAVSKSSNQNTSLRQPVITPFVKTRVVPSITEEIMNEPTVIPSSKIEPTPLDVPNTFYLNYIHNNAPPTKSNFIQLNEILDRLLSQAGNQIEERSPAYDVVFIELIRQYFIECSAQGRLLDKLHKFYESLSHHIPALNKRYEDELSRIKSTIETQNAEVEKMNQDLIPNEEKLDHLQHVVSELRNDYQTLTKYLDELNHSITRTSKELSDIKGDSEKLGSRVQKKNQKLVHLNEELRSLDEQSAKCSSDTVTVADCLRNLLNQAEAAQSQKEQTTKEIENLKYRISQSNSEITCIQTMIEEANKYSQTVDASVQADLVTTTRKRMSSVHSTSIDDDKNGGNPIYQIFSEDPSSSTPIYIPKQGVTIGTYEDFSVLKNLIIENHDHFVMTAQELEETEKGDVEIKEENIDKIRLFASILTSDILDRATRKLPHFDHGIQTLPRPPVRPPEPVKPSILKKRERIRRISIPTNAVPSSSTVSQRKDAAIPEVMSFTQMIGADYSDREPHPLSWIIKTIRAIYDEKHQDDLRRLENGEELLPLDRFVIEYTKKKSSLDFQAHQECWDIQISGEFFRDGHQEIEMFMQALENDITTDQMCFMLKCRDYIMKIGAVVSAKQIDSPDVISEYYLSQDQIEPALRKWWKNRYQPKFLHKVNDYAVARPAAHLEATKRYISMNNILTVCVSEFANDTVARMYELLQKTRFAPRLSQEDFEEFAQSLIPYLSSEDCSRFYRAMVTKSAIRFDTTKEEFANVFKSQSILYAKEEPEKHDIKLGELLDTIDEMWAHSQYNLQYVLKYFESKSDAQPDNLVLRGLVTDAQRYQSMITHSLSIHNTVEACFNYFQLIFTLDVLFSSVKHFNIETGESTLLSLECCIREYWLDSAFDHAPE